VPRGDKLATRVVVNELGSVDWGDVSAQVSGVTPVTSIELIDEVQSLSFRWNHQSPLTTQGIHRFLHSLRSLLRIRSASALITLPAELARTPPRGWDGDRDSWVRSLAWGVDSCVELRGFGGECGRRCLLHRPPPPSSSAVLENTRSLSLHRSSHSPSHCDGHADPIHTPRLAKPRTALPPSPRTSHAPLFPYHPQHPPSEHQDLLPPGRLAIRHVRFRLRRRFRSWREQSGFQSWEETVRGGDCASWY
jgi:hypothetical protein